jgi:hypothetical protein
VEDISVGVEDVVLETGMVEDSKSHGGQVKSQVGVGNRSDMVINVGNSGQWGLLKPQGRDVRARLDELDEVGDEDIVDFVRIDDDGRDVF